MVMLCRHVTKQLILGVRFQLPHQPYLIWVKHYFLLLTSSFCVYFHVYTVSQKKPDPLLHFQITPTILVQYQQNLVQRIVN